MPAPTLLLRLTDRIVAPLGVLDRPFTVGKLLTAARRSVGASAEWPGDISEAMGHLVRSYSQEARLSTFGRISARWDLVRLLSNLYRLRAEEMRDPSILAESIARPIFITGLPRSGTTFLHSLLAEDPASLAPRCWQTIYPYPMAGEAADDTALRRHKVDQQLATFGRLAPDVQKVHPLSADMPQECSEITAHVFRSLRFDTTHRVPSYTAWLDAAGHHEAYAFHKRFLQHLQRQSGAGRWVLKCPDHVFAIDAIKAVYPDALFVFVHRDPLHILSSVARLTEILRGPFTREIDRAQIGRQVADRWVDGAARITRADQTGELPPDSVFHVRYQELVADPAATVTALYRRFGMLLSEEAARRIQALIAARPHGGYGQNEYRPDDFGLDSAELRDRVREYTDHFDISTATTPRSRRLQASAA